MIFKYHIHEVSEYINWIYFFHAWGFQPRFATIAQLHGCDSCRAMWLASFPEKERSKASEAMQLFKEAQRMLNILDKDYNTHGICEIKECNSSDDNIIVDNVSIPLLRQQTANKNGVYLCLSDFIRPAESGVKDKIGLFATTVDAEMERLYSDDDYKRMLVQTLCDRLAEATAEKMHEYVRKELWGYAKDEKLAISEMLEEKFQGTRPAVGYPSLPDQSLNFILNDIIDLSRIGIQLTENGMMIPHASVSGFMISHPKSQYFSIGKISKEQLTDYSKRRGFTISETEKFLSANL